MDRLYRKTGNPVATDVTARPMRTRYANARVVCLFGLDGAGKTTHSYKTLATLKARGLEVAYARPKLGMLPWNNGADSPPISEGKRASRVPNTCFSSILRRVRLAVVLEAAIAVYLFNVAKDIWVPVLKNKLVVAERYWPDTLADFSVDFGIDQPLSEALSRFCSAPPSAIYIYLQIDPAKALERKEGPYSLQYLQKRHSVYERFSSKIDAVRVVSEGDPTQTHDDIMKALGSWAGKAIP